MTRWSTLSARPTGATSTPSASARATTRVSTWGPWGVLSEGLQEAGSMAAGPPNAKVMSPVCKTDGFYWLFYEQASVWRRP